MAAGREAKSGRKDPRTLQALAVALKRLGLREKALKVEETSRSLSPLAGEWWELLVKTVQMLRNRT